MFTLLTALAFYYTSLYTSVDYIAWLIELILKQEVTESIPAEKQDESKVTRGISMVSINGPDPEPTVNDAKRRHAREVFTTKALSSPVTSLKDNADSSIFPNSLTLASSALSVRFPPGVNFRSAVQALWKSSIVSKVRTTITFGDWGSSTFDMQEQRESFSCQSSVIEPSDSASPHRAPRIGVQPINVRSAISPKASIASNSSCITLLPLNYLGNVENEVVQASGADSVPENTGPQNIIPPTDLSDIPSLKAFIIAKLPSGFISDLFDRTRSTVSPLPEPNSTYSPNHNEPKRSATFSSILRKLHILSPPSRQNKPLPASHHPIRAALASRLETQDKLQASASMARYRLRNLRSHGPKCVHCVIAKIRADRALEEFSAETERLREREA